MQKPLAGVTIAAVTLQFRKIIISWHVDSVLMLLYEFSVSGQEVVSHNSSESLL